MRTLMIAGLAMVTAIAATPAESQRLAPAPMGGGQAVMGGGQMMGGGQVYGGGQVMGGGYNHNGGQNMPPPPHGGAPMGHTGGHYPPQRPPMMHQSRWGGSINGHWSGGMNAPGGWNAYRRPTRGWTLPRFWIAPTFYISDYADYGLATPPAGYGWSRYYDDAVLIDGRGRVWDSVNGVDWDGAGDAEGGEGGYAMAGDGYAQGGAGGYGAGYAPPQQQPVEYRGDAQGGYTSTTYSSSAGYASGGGYVANGYYFPPATTTVVTIQSAPVVTTTTTEYVETYRAARRVYRAPVRHRVVRRSCTCSCGCR